ncbi:peptidoglycan-binding protein [Bacillus massiliglaciei]|uniref:peptidoglycan-binding protein n=1 Tax=Bacillus massiliglaciei TaxID=1816693 RepID=UPI000A9AAAD9|nr:peptidoglycan-binding protein [Bacillus massiliglaciei]
MTVALQTLIDRSVKNMGSGIHPVVKESAIELIKRAYDEGIFVQISAGYRSMTEQAKLYGQGRLGYTYNGVNYSNVAKAKVTNAKPGQSYHNFGLAVDYFLVSDDGNTALWTVNDKWKRVAAIGKSLGFKWGGDWKSFKDYPHLEMTGGLSYSQLLAGKKPNLVSKVNGTSAPKAQLASEVSKPAKPATKSGDANIKAFQKKLNSRYNTGIAEDGYFGPETLKAALKGFQTELNKQYKSGLAVDGKWGPKTKAATPTVRKSAEGNITYILQGLLYVNGHDPKGIDGMFGSNTEKAVKSFQGAHKLSKDGIAGPNTFEKLFA